MFYILISLSVFFIIYDLKLKILLKEIWKKFGIGGNNMKLFGTSKINEKGNLSIGGMDTLDLVRNLEVLFM